MANHAFIVDSHQAELRNERGRLAQSLNETRFVWPTECQLIDPEDFLMILRSLSPDGDHAPCLACVHSREGVEHWPSRTECDGNRARHRRDSSNPLPPSN